MTALRQGTVTDEYGRPVPGAQVYVYDRANASALLFSDAGATIPLAQPITADEFGLYSYYAADGIYREDTWYLGKLRFREILLVGSVDVLKGLPGSPTAGSYATRAAIAALAAVGLDSVDLTEAGREGRFIFDASNLSAKVAIDPNQGVYIAPASDTTGVHGAWVRKFVGPAAASWFGAGTADDTAIIASAFAVSPKLIFGAQTYTVTSMTVPVGGQIITQGFATLFKQKAFTPTNTRLIKLSNGSSIVGDISVEGQLNQAGDTTDEQNHGIFIYCDNGATSDVANVRIGSVNGKNIRGDVVMIGIHPAAYGAGFRVSNIHVERVTGDNIYRNGVSIVGGKTIRIAGVECTHVGLYDLDIEPDAGSGPVIDLDVGSVRGSYVGAVNAGPATDYLDKIHFGLLDLDPAFSTSSTPAFPGAHFFPDALIIRNVRFIRIDRFKANNYNGQAIFQIYNGGELALQRVSLGLVELTSCCLTEIVHNAYICGSPAIMQLRVDERLIAATTLNSHVVVVSCYGAEIHNPVFTGLSGAWKGFNDCPKSKISNLSQTNGFAAVGSPGICFDGGTFNGDTFFSFCNDAAAYEVDVTASTAPNVGGNGVKFYGGTLGGVRNTLAYYNGGTALITVDGGGVTSGYEFHALNKFQGEVYDSGGNKVLGTQQTPIANAVGAAGPTPTGAEFNGNANALNAILTALRTHGIIDT